MDVSSFGKDSTGTFAMVDGVWNLTIDFQGQAVPVTLTLKQDNAKVSGTLDSAMVKGEMTDAKVSGNKIIGVVKTQMGGQAMELNISGTVEGDTMKGTVTIPMPGAPPLTFTGTKAK